MKEDNYYYNTDDGYGYDSEGDQSYDALEEITDFWEEDELPAGQPDHLKSQRKPSRRKTAKVGRILLVILLIFFLIITAALIWLVTGRSQGRKNLSKPVAEIPKEEVILPKDTEIREGAIVYNGETWYPAENQINILLMGIDNRTINTQDTIAAGDSGQADVLLLASFDTEKGMVNLLTISRDSMVDVGVYDTGGNYLYTKKMQICLSYGYGDGREMSCENTARSVQRLLYGVPIHAYAAMDMDGLSALNDAVGGVRVKALETLGNGITEGEEITLTAGQVETYIRSRDSYNPDPEVARTGNNRRMERQKQYLSGLISAVREKTKKDVTFPVKVFGTMRKYMVTDITVDDVTYLSSMLLSSGHQVDAGYNVPGEAVLGEEYAEYHVDEEKLFPMVLELFYNKEN